MSGGREIEKDVGPLSKLLCT